MRKYFVFILVLTLVYVIGCNSGSVNPAVPSGLSPEPAPALSEQVASTNSVSNHVLWGFWEVSIDKQSGEVDLVGQRGVMFNANIAHFLAPPYNPDILISFKVLDGTDFPAGYLNLEVSMSHPFPGLNKFKGFDVRTILIADGSKNSEHDPDIRYSAAENDEVYMINPDGFIRWWNPSEFTDPLPLFSYKPFAIGTLPYPTATLNPYKYFADDLSFDGNVADLPPETRGVFTNSDAPRLRNYQVQFPVEDGNPVIRFNLAVDASWQMPDPSGAPDYPVASFPPGAQCQEAYHLDLDTSGSDAWYAGGESGGSLKIELTVFDWQGLVNPGGVPGEVESIWVESPVLLQPVDILPLASISPGTQTTSSVFEVELGQEYLDLTNPGTFRVLGSVGSVNPATYQPQIVGGESIIYPEGPLAAYFIGSVVIQDQPPFLTIDQPNGGEVWQVGSARDITWSGGTGVNTVILEYSTDDFVSDIHTIAEDLPNTGLFTWDPIPDDPSETVKVRVSDTLDLGNNDESDDYFAIEELTGGWELIFPDPPEQISDSQGEGWSNEAPRLIKDGQGRIVVSWAQNRPNVPDQADSRPVDRISPDQGSTWDPMNTFPTTYYDRAGYLLGTKMALDANGDAYALDFWYDEEGPFITMWCNYLIRSPFDSDEDWGWQCAMSIHGVELAFTVDGYPLCFEDYDLLPGYTGIQVAKGLWQNSPLGLESGQWNKHSWWVIGQYYQVAEDPVALSTGPSIQRDSTGTLWLAYQNGPYAPDQILMVHNTDPSMEFWSSPLLVGEAGMQYEKCFDPTLWLDSSSGMHLAYIRSEAGPPVSYSLVYLSAVSGDPVDFGPEVETLSSVFEIGYPTIQCAELPIGLSPTVLVSNGDVINCSWYNPVTADWCDPIQVDLNSTASTPAMWIDQQNRYVHVVWAEPDVGGYMQVMYRRGEFVEL